MLPISSLQEIWAEFCDHHSLSSHYNFTKYKCITKPCIIQFHSFWILRTDFIVYIWILKFASVTQHFKDSFLLMYKPVVHSLLLLYRILPYEYVTVYPFPCWWAFFFIILKTRNNAPMNILLYVTGHICMCSAEQHCVTKLSAVMDVFYVYAIQYCSQYSQGLLSTCNMASTT